MVSAPSTKGKLLTSKTCEIIFRFGGRRRFTIPGNLESLKPNEMIPFLSDLNTVIHELTVHRKDIYEVRCNDKPVSIKRILAEIEDARDLLSFYISK